MILSPKYQLIQKLAKEFAENEIPESMQEEIDQTGEFPKSLYNKITENGFFGIKVPKEYGGQGGDNLAYVLFVEQISRVSMVTSICLSGANSLGSGPLLNAGTPEQLEKYLRPVAEGKKFPCFALTEPGAGSDAAGLQSSAVRDGDYYVLNGRKTFITGAPIADFAVVYAKTDFSKGAKGISAFIVDMDTPGITLGRDEKKMGIIGMPTSDIILEDVRIHKDNLLGEEGMGFINAMKTLDVGRLGVSATALGVAQACMEEAIDFAKNRKQFGQRIADFQSISFMIAQMATQIQACRELLYNSAVLKDTNAKDAGMHCSMAKLFITETACKIAHDALQIHGGYGYIKDYRIERLYRDIRVNTLFEGTSQVQHIVIAKELLKK